MIVESVEVAQSKEDAAKSFSDGFDDNEDQTTTPEAKEVTEPPKEAEVPAQAKEEPKEDAPKFAQITETQLAELMAKASQFDDGRRKIDTLSGHLGGLKQQIDGLKQQNVKIGPGQLKRLTAELPEVAQMLEEDLAGLIGTAPDPEEISKRFQSEVDSRLAEKSIEFETKLLRFYHRDWQQVDASPEFAAWKNTLPPDEKTKLENSRDGEYIADKLTEFKAAKAAADEAAKKAKEIVDAKQTSAGRQKRLEAAVTPRGTGGQSSSRQEKSDFMAGWDSA